FEYMEDVSWVMSVASSAQSPQTKNYLAKKSGGYKNVRSYQQCQSLQILY
ncbi:hypothetical protein RhiirA4_407746, partial [Rhizophagus irregularis]